MLSPVVLIVVTILSITKFGAGKGLLFGLIAVLASYLILLTATAILGSTLVGVVPKKRQPKVADYVSPFSVAVTILLTALVLHSLKFTSYASVLFVIYFMVHCLHLYLDKKTHDMPRSLVGFLASEVGGLAALVIIH
jgi:hypothetical protein